MTDVPPRLIDIPEGGWVARCPRRVRPYLRLMRLDRPIGTWLLLLPCWWSAALAFRGAPEFGVRRLALLFVLFAIGAVVMRGAGCVVNDIADRDFDGRVGRTATRPLPSGEVSLFAAFAFLGLLLLSGLVVLVQLHRTAIFVGLASVLLFVPYPFMKRITYWPQAWLGLTFNWGALVGWAAVRGSLDWAPVLLYLGGVCWTLGYDTIYAHQDKAFDREIGVKSSALALGDRTRPFLFVIFAAALVLIAGGLVLGGAGPWAWLFVVLGAVHLLWQAVTVETENPANCLARFRSNRDFGLLIALAALF